MVMEVVEREGRRGGECVGSGKGRKVKTQEGKKSEDTTRKSWVAMEGRNGHIERNSKECSAEGGERERDS